MEPSDYRCPTCNSPMVKRQGLRGPFLCCSAYPACRTVRKVDAEGRPIEPPHTGVRCDLCGSPMAVKRGPRGLFLGCSTYPRCRHTRAMDGGG